MSKKNRDMQVTLKEEKVEYQNELFDGATLWFGKRLMGSIIRSKHGGYLGFLADDENNIIRAHEFDECIELLIKEWNLQKL